MNHYDTLGIARDADEATVKRAYRKRATKAHPDRDGGSEEQMQAINDAYAVLSDPARRLQYDQTGRDGDRGTPEDAAVQMLMQLFDQAIGATEKRMLKWMRQRMAGIQDGAIGAKLEAEEKTAALTARRAKVKVKEGATNLLHTVIDRKLAALASQKTQATDMLNVLAAARKMLDDYESSEEGEDPVRPKWIGVDMGAGFSVSDWGIR